MKTDSFFVCVCVCSCHINFKSITFVNLQCQIFTFCSDCSLGFSPSLPVSGSGAGAKQMLHGRLPHFTVLSQYKVAVSFDMNHVIPVP